MTKDKKPKRRASASLKFPFTAKELRKFASSIPDNSSVRLCEVRSGDKSSQYVEASWWEEL